MSKLSPIGGWRACPGPQPGFSPGSVAQTLFISPCPSITKAACPSTPALPGSTAQGPGLRAQSLGCSGVLHPGPACDQAPSSVCSGWESKPLFGPVYLLLPDVFSHLTIIECVLCAWHCSRFCPVVTKADRDPCPRAPCLHLVENSH